MEIKETWKPIYLPGYEASSTGRLRNSQGRILKGSICKPKGRTEGYISHTFSGAQGERVDEYAHIVIARAFLGEKHEGQEVNHKDGNKLNNAPDNLEYLTKQQHRRHSIDVLGANKGLRNARYTKPYSTIRGEDHPHAKLTWEIVRSIRAIHRPRKFGKRRIARLFNLKESTVGGVLYGAWWNEDPLHIFKHS